MSIVFVPKIPKNLKAIKPVDKAKTPSFPQQGSLPWSKKQLVCLVELRAMGVTFKDCGPILSRTQGACVTAVVTNDLYGEIEARRKSLIAKVLNP